MQEHRWIRAGAPRGLRGAVLGATLAGVVTLTACDLGVTNPANIEEADLNVPGAIPSIVNGARHTFGMATTIQGAGGVYSVGAALTDELTHVGSWAPPRDISNGVPGNDAAENQSHWGYSSRARWQAEDAIGKVSALVDNPQANEWVALATLYAGFSNRLLGENFCDAVIDGGPRQPHTAFFERAEAHFTNAIAIAGAANRADLREAAYAGRAQVRMSLGKWAEAVSDAGQVTTGFVYAQPHSSNTGNENNGVFNWSADAVGQYSVWGTPFAEWGRDVTGTVESDGDPRASFEWRAAVGGGSPDRPYWFTARYESRDDAIPIAKGTEMRLIEAEALLRGGNVEGAVEAINLVRRHHGLEDAVAGTIDEAWALLMKERGLELWLEGRRLGDLRRWAAESNTRPRITAMAWRGGETLEPAIDASPFCLRVSTNEIFANPNITGNDVQ
jgi:starch-binding outer membrane protein, SusD/RagB family